MNAPSPNFADFVAQDGRLIILRELAAQVNNTSNESILTDVLELWGVRKSRDWTRTQMRWLAEQGAVRLTDRDGFLICELTQAGMDHVSRRGVIDGVKRPTLR